MKKYKITITDGNGYTGDITATASTQSDAKRQAQAYINAWGLQPAKIEQITQAN